MACNLLQTKYINIYSNITVLKRAYVWGPCKGPVQLEVAPMAPSFARRLPGI